MRRRKIAPRRECNSGRATPSFRHTPAAESHPDWVLPHIWCRDYLFRVSLCPVESSGCHQSAPGGVDRQRAPYIWRLIVLRRLIWPSTGLILQGCVIAARTASMSRPLPAAREVSSLAVASAIHCSRPASSSPRITAAKRRASSPAIESSRRNFRGVGEGTAWSAHREMSGLRSGAMHNSGAMAAATANLVERSMTAPCGRRSTCRRSPCCLQIHDVLFRSTAATRCAGLPPSAFRDSLEKDP